MNRSFFYTGQILRGFDLANIPKDALRAISNAVQAVLGTNDTVLDGFSAAAQTVPNLDITLAPGQIYQWAAVDAEDYGVLPADASFIYQQGTESQSQTLAISTSQLTSGESQYVLIQGSFEQQDEIRFGDPTPSGIYAFYNSANPTIPLQGPSGLGGSLPSVRIGAVNIEAIYGTPAISGSEVPPAPTTGFAPLYLIDLNFGQTAITQGDILEAGPVANALDYPVAPFLAGLLNSHHNGQPGQAPQIKLTSEVQEVLPLANLPASNVVGKLPCHRMGSGSPQTVLAGQLEDLYTDDTNGNIWTCTTAGSSPSSTTWQTGTSGGGGGGGGSGTPAPIVWTLVTSFPLNVTGTYGWFALEPSAPNSVVNLPAATAVCNFKFKNVGTPGNNALITPVGSTPIDGQTGAISLSSSEASIEVGSEITYSTTGQWFTD